MIIGLDYETYSAVNLKVHGLDRYVNHPTFTVLIAALSTPSVTAVAGRPTEVFDFILDSSARKRFVSRMHELVDQHHQLVAHNAGFEIAVNKTFGLDDERFNPIDSAALGRMNGAESALEAAAPQILNMNKFDEGRDLIKLFCVPSKQQEESGNLHFDPQIVEDNRSAWDMFVDYCVRDALLAAQILEVVGMPSTTELQNIYCTQQMNEIGWPVDVELVQEMHRRYLENLQALEEDFRLKTGALDLNLNSLKQLKAWCLERGIRATSFDEAHVESLLARVSKKLHDPVLPTLKAQMYTDVYNMLYTKKELGGSSLKKLKTILDTVGEDGRLRGQYVHAGASATWRTSGRSVQMQNLKRLHGQGEDVTELFHLSNHWDNDKMAANLRQCFTSSHPQGELIVGDFSSVEARGLPWLAQDSNKLLAFAQGKDMYKEQASTMFGKPYDLITKDERQTGKVGVLSCGYQAGPEAVQTFAGKMGVELTEAEAAKLVYDWRAANPLIVELWTALDQGLQALLQGQTLWNLPVSDGHTVQFSSRAAPLSLLEQTNQPLRSLDVKLLNVHQERLMRTFHGLYTRGKDVCYFKPSRLKGGELWKSFYVDPKTKQRRYYNLYGGKLSGILTQSLCRELFFDAVRRAQSWAMDTSNVQLIGQFHDELVMDWVPIEASRNTGNFFSLWDAKAALKTSMTNAWNMPSFPLESEIHSSYRYIK